jgi:enoyl-[acyl-carrier-protein] reductase (NADH)
MVKREDADNIPVLWHSIGFNKTVGLTHSLMNIKAENWSRQIPFPIGKQP